MGLPSILFKKALQLRMGTPNFLPAQENFKQLLLYLYNTDLRCYSDSHTEPQSPKEHVKSLKLDRVKLALIFFCPVLMLQS